MTEIIGIVEPLRMMATHVAWRRRRSGLDSLIPALLLSLLWAVPVGPTATAREVGLDQLLAELRGEDLFSSQKAAVEIRNRGTDVLVPLGRFLQEARGGRELLVESLFKHSLSIFLDELENEILSLAEEQATILKLEEHLKLLEGRQETDEEAAERLKILTERVEERAPRVEELKEVLDRLIPVALGEILKRMEFLSPHLVVFYAAVFDGAIGFSGAGKDAVERETPGEGNAGKRQQEGLLPDVESPEFQERRYLLSPLWYWALLRNGPLAESVRPLLERHLEATFQDLRDSDYRVRERAEDEFYLLRERGLDVLRAERDLTPEICDRLIPLLDWRIHPRLRERTAMDFNNFREMDFRERRSHVIRYARTAGQDAIPTLRLLVLDDSRESSIRVKLTAAEQLAGLRDNTGLAVLTRKPLPELLKIPEISRDVYIIKGAQYQAEKKYDLAIQEFQKVLDESPFHFQANYRIAFVYLLSKQFKKSIHHFEIARRIRPNDMLTLYNLACAYSLDGQTERALDALEKSVEAGFTDAKHIQKDPDLDPIRDLSRFKDLLKKLETE